jgi:hypothetical protein
VHDAHRHFAVTAKAGKSRRVRIGCRSEGAMIETAGNAAKGARCQRDAV